MLRLTPEQFRRIQAARATGSNKPEPKPSKPSKMGNVPTIVDGVRFASKREAARWEQLRLLEAAGKITELRRQVPFRLEVCGKLVAKYVSDFVYIENGKHKIEDAKGYRTPVYKLKRRFMSALGHEILEV
jgi:uncharacterized protein DUF1064